MDWFGPFEFLALISFLAASFVSFSLIGSSPMNEKRKAWYRKLWHPFERMKPDPYTLMALLAFIVFDLALSGWGAWVTPIRYFDVNDTDESKELIAIWDGSKDFWKFATIIALHITTLFLIPIWMRMIFAWKKLVYALMVIAFQSVISLLLTIFGYLFYWPVGIGYSIYALFMLYFLWLNYVFWYGKYKGKISTTTQEVQESLLPINMNETLN